MESDADSSKVFGNCLRDSHIRYEDGALPDTVDISTRAHEAEISIKVFLFSPLHSRIRRFSTPEFGEASAMPMMKPENVLTERIASTAMVCWICEVVGFLNE